MKKRIISLTMCLVMLLSLFPVTALASGADDIKHDLSVTESTLNGKLGLMVEWKVSSASEAVYSANICFAYDSSVFELVDSSGAAVSIPSSAGDVSSGRLETISGFDFTNRMLGLVDGSNVLIAFEHGSMMSSVSCTTATLFDKCFLAYKDGYNASNVTKDKLRLATAAEAKKLTMAAVVYTTDATSAEYIIGHSDGQPDTAGWSSNISFAKDFDFAKPALEGSVSISGTAQIGQVLTATPSITSADPGELTYKWYRSDSTTPISGATGNTYTPSSAEDVGKTIKVEVSAANYSGSVTATTSGTVDKADGTAPADLTAAAFTITDTQISVTTPDAALEYAVVANDAAESWPAEKKTSFTGLNPDTDYDIYYRTAETGTHNASTAKKLDVKTTKAQIPDDAKGTLAGYTGDYDGNPHDAVTGAPAAGYTVDSYSITSESDGFSATMPKVTNVADSKTVWVKVTRSGYEDKVFAVTATVNKVAPTVTGFAAKTGLVYGDSEQELITVGSVTGGTVQYKLGDTGTYGTAVPKAKDAGNYTVYYKVEGDANHTDLAETSLDVSIGKKDLTIGGATITAKTYDRTMTIATSAVTAVTLTGDVDSMVLGTDFEVTTASYTDNADAGTNKATSITVALKDTEKAKNYNLPTATYTSAKADITAADYTYTVAATQTFRTGSGLSAITVAPAAGTGVNGEPVDGTLGWYTDGAYFNPAEDYTLSSVEANSSVILHWKFTASNGNYTTTPKKGNTVFTAKDKEDLSASIKTTGITGLNKAYDGEVASYTGSATVDGHTELNSSLVYEWYKADNTKLTGAPKDVGNYYLKVSIPEANPDYIGSAKVDFTISKREVTVAAGTYKVSKTYDGTVNVGSATITGALSVTGILPADSDVTVEATPVAYGSNGVGAQSSMNVNIALTGTGSENYKIKDDATTVTVPCEITAKPITINTATATNRDYAVGNVSVETDVTFDGVIGTLTKGTDYTVTGEMDDANAGTGKTVNVTVTLTNNNYSLTANTTTTTVTINQIDLTTPTGLTGLKDMALSTVALPDGWTWDAPSTTMSTLGDQIFKASYAGSINYKAKANVDVTVTVSNKAPAGVSISGAPTSKTYGDADFTLTASVTDAGTGMGTWTWTSSDPTVLQVTGSGATATVKVLKASATGATITAKYESDTTMGEQTTAAITVGKRVITVTADNKSMTVNGTLPTFTVTYGNLPSGVQAEDIFETLASASTTTDGKTTGSFDITVTTPVLKTEAEANYEVGTVTKGTLTVNSASSGGGGGGVSTYAITISSAKNGDVTSSHKSAAKGTTVTLTVDPDKGYTLETITVTDGSGKEVKLTEKNGKYTFTMPASKVTVKATFMEDNSMLNFFVDVPANAYYYDAVLWAAENGITGGVDATHFAPNATCTRAQAVTFLWRAAGSPAPKSSENPFTDVKDGSYYYDAVLWAVENGITNGTSATAFSPNATCSRAQIVTFLWRSQKSPAADTVNPFTDVATDSYYANAVVWAAENGITGGTSATTFSPNNDCTRAQIVTFLFRCLGE